MKAAHRSPDPHPTQRNKKEAAPTASFFTSFLSAFALPIPQNCANHIRIWMHDLHQKPLIVFTV
jgi:hypothetical protein